MGDWNENLPYEQREYAGHFYDTDEAVSVLIDDEECSTCEHYHSSVCIYHCENHDRYTPIRRQHMTREEAIAILDGFKHNPLFNEQHFEALDMAISALSAEPCRETDDYENEIADLHNRLDIAEYDKERYKEEITTLEAENKGEWIPVSDRLPVLKGTYKISDDVLITNGYEIDMGYLVERTGRIFWHYYGSEYEVGVKDEDNDATAWQPLPEPYKAEKGGE